MKRLKIVDRDQVCPRRQIPIVDVYLFDGGECWMQSLDVSVEQAKKIAAWFKKLKGVRVKTDVEEASSDPNHQRSLFDA